MRTAPADPAGTGGTARLRTARLRKSRARTAALLAVLTTLTVLTACGPGQSTGSPAAPGPAAATTTSSAPGTHSPSGNGAAPVHALPRSEPVRLRIPAIGVDTQVIPLGLAADGTVQVPPIAPHSPAGWYDGSPTPGSTGPSVILGHVTVGRYGDGVFRRLSALGSGDRILVGLQNGVTAVFGVDSVQTVDKAHFPTNSVYGNVDHPALRLITCGGTRTGGGYADNVVVYASLVR
ncbi:class F sortase [Actinacidiphila acididurans]|uniref:Class F sortase n=1 Tax=Actinacidiphila acididurans TaxID=2784346 RepID=A0ABS2U504_9ACTN|nr:class F sortase [Actinacidiphila acididurans]MBM9510417.1 class F sortase [Actinacidiphila acididurans]